MAETIEVARLIVPLIGDTKGFTFGLKQAGEQAKKTEKALFGLGKRVRDTFKGATQPLKTFTSWGEKIKQAVVTKGLNLVVDAAHKASAAIVGLGQSSIMAAARVQELGALSQLVGQKAGYTSTEIDKYTKAVIGAGIQTDVAIKTVTQFARANLDMSKASKLARIAQDAATHAGAGSSETLDRVLYGIQSYEKEVLQTAGLNVNFAQTFEKAAKAAGKHKDALTEVEKQNAALNAVMEAGTAIAGSYEAAMKTPGKLLRSLPRYFNEIKIAMGDPFLESFANVLSVVKTGAKAMQGMVTEGGALFPTLMQLGAVASIVTDKIGGIAKQLVEAGTATEEYTYLTVNAMGEVEPAVVKASKSIVEKWVDRLKNAAFESLKWGINIATQLASGIIQGAASAITTAMNFIGGLLSGNLSGKSPPKIAPDIDKWGASAMGVFLRGMTSANFDVLEGLQAPLQTALSRLVDAGDIGQKEGFNLFRSLSSDVSEALVGFQKTGKVSEDLFKKLEAAGGGFGKDLAELARRQFKLAEATKKVKEAEENLARARTAQKDAQSDVRRLAKEYNALLDAGADPAILEAKRKEFLAAKDQSELADEQLIQAEKQKEETEGILSPLQEQVSLQQKVLDQLFKMTEPITLMTDAMEKMTGAGGGAIELPKPVFPKPDLEGPVNQALENAKKIMGEKLKELFAPVMEEWNKLSAEGGPIDKLKKAWNGLKEDFDKFWNSPAVVSIREWFAEIMPDDALEKIGRFAGILAIGAIAAGVLAVAIALLTSPIILLAAGLAIVAIWGGAAWQMWTDLSVLAQILGKAIKAWLIDKVYDAIQMLTDLTELAETLGGAIKTWLIDKANELVILIEEKLLLVFTKVQTIVETVTEKFNILVESSKTLGTAIKTWLIDKASDLVVVLETKVIETLVKVDTWFRETLPEALQGFMDNILTPLVTGFDNLWKALKEATTWFGNLWEKVKAMGGRVWDALKLFVGQSPSPLERGLVGISDAMRELSTFTIPEFTARINTMPSPQQVAGGTTTDNRSYSLTVHTRADTSTYVQDWRMLGALA